MNYKKDFLKGSLLALAVATPWISQVSFAASLPAVEAKNGMVVSSQRFASEAGVEILKMGGNAVDAAVAVGYAQAVVNSCCGNIGGGGFMTLHMADGSDHFIDFREMAPAAASAKMYQDKDGNLIPHASTLGWGAVGVPGTVRGMELALQKYGSGKLTRAQIMAPAIKLAREGFILTRGDTDVIDSSLSKMRGDKQAAKIFLHADGSPLEPGDRLTQTALAKTLDMIAKDGPDAFYKGDIPKAIEKASKANGGYLTAKDFENYVAKERTPVRCSYRGYDFISAPPPSSGGTTMCQILNILEGYDLKSMGYGSADAIHYTAEAMRHAFVDRNNLLGDPDFVNVPMDKLLSKEYAAQIRAKIDPVMATPSSELGAGVPPHEKPQTTHYSVLDKAGNAVSTTYTINGRFGAGVMAPGYGFWMNDEMDDFTSKIGAKNMFGLVQGKANAIAPGKRPLSSMSPTIITKDGKTFMVVGSPGGSLIITITLNTVMNVIDYGMTLQEAVNAPRIHQQWLPDVVIYEKRGISPDTLKILKQRGYNMVEKGQWGAAEAIMIGLPSVVSGDEKSNISDASVSGKIREGFIYGANDARRPQGAAVGY
ncbi:gamma-glutamyltransferase [Shewanella mangrovi]|uniref:Glutathione hydrolase proenzyme n=1 Tax=Shewanella mangrovi TaxID=1515746 RepID=A0A094JIL0_9GAMM|nr:gamma-glutamyltransferase [Shewanella mangrovi]KFZ39057.1 gamma-glutamyltransferase [Shewanella mangrovi]